MEASKSMVAQASGRLFTYICIQSSRKQSFCRQKITLHLMSRCTSSIIIIGQFGLIIIVDLTCRRCVFGI